MKSSRRPIKRTLLCVLAILAAWIIVHLVLIIYDGLNDELGRADVAVVFGNTVERDGTPSARLRARLDKTLELYRNGLATRIIVSGGFGAEGFDEAVVMRDYLVANGVAQAQIILDQSGNNTYLTARHVKEIMAREQLSSAIIISQYFHISRAKLAFSKFGIASAYSAHADYYELRDLYSLLREFVGYYSYLMKDYK